MTGWLEGEVTANGIRLHYYRTGSSRTGEKKPSLVLSHGFSDSGLCWVRLARALEGDYEVVMYDARGHGLSDAPDEGYTSVVRADDLAGLIEALGLEKPAILGHSMGAATTLYCAALHPDLMRAAVLEDGGVRSSQPGRGFDPGRAAAMHQSALAQREMTKTALMARCRAEHPTWDELELEPWAEAKRQLSPKAIGHPIGTETLSWQDALARVNCPILLITADVDRGSSVAPETAEEARRILPSLRVGNIPGAGHNVRREQFERYVETVREFLAS
jgi:N-formylmaleamate deformylase